jgi:uncharacterized damage-inducible protein DinB
MQEDRMTLQEIKTLHAFNAWATNKIFDAVAQIPEDAYFKDMKASHGSIHGTLAHLAAAEKIWLLRWLGTPEEKLVGIGEVPTLSDLKTAWEGVGYDMAKFLGTMTDRKLQETFTMTNARGRVFTHTYWQAIQHVVDHSTYHRGQVVTLLRQQGFVPPATGLITFYRDTSRSARE